MHISILLLFIQCTSLVYSEGLIIKKRFLVESFIDDTEISAANMLYTTLFEFPETKASGASLLDPSFSKAEKISRIVLFEGTDQELKDFQNGNAGIAEEDYPVNIHRPLDLHIKPSNISTDKMNQTWHSWVRCNQYLIECLFHNYSRWTAF